MISKNRSGGLYVIYIMEVIDFRLFSLRGWWSQGLPLTPILSPSHSRYP
jgi:hypothetical protein